MVFPNFLFIINNIRLYTRFIDLQFMVIGSLHRNKFTRIDEHLAGMYRLFGMMSMVYNVKLILFIPEKRTMAHPHQVIRLL